MLYCICDDNIYDQTTNTLRPLNHQSNLAVNYLLAFLIYHTLI